MSNILDYVRTYGNETFTERLFSSADALVLAQLSYMDWSEAVPGLKDEKDFIRLKDLLYFEDLERMTRWSVFKTGNRELFYQAVNSKRFGDVKLNFYGSGPDEDNIKKSVEELGINSNVIFHGKVSSPETELLKNDIYLITSDYEGIPNSLIEAMSIGMPCIATDCSPGGAALLVEHEKNGILVPCGDWRAVADAVIHWIENPRMAADCGKNATMICEKFSAEVIIEKWNRYIYKIVKGEEK